MVGIELQSNGIVACVVNLKKGEFNVDNTIFEPFDNVDDKALKLAQALKSLSAKCDLTQSKLDIVLSSSQYQLLLIEAPNVPKDEITSAVLWGVKDLVSVPQEYIHIDVFDLPAVKNKASKKMIYVVVTDKRDIQRIADAASDSGLTLNSINIQEMVLRDLLLRVDGRLLKDDAVALVRIVKGAGYIFIYKEGDLFLSRQFKLNYSGGLLDELPSEIVQTEIQRSLDYFERQMGQSLPRNVLFFGENIQDDNVKNAIDDDFPVTADLLDVSGFCRDEDALSEVQVGIAAMGAALRFEKEI